MELKLLTAEQCARLVFSTGLTCAEIARRLGVSVSVVTRLKKDPGKRYRNVEGMRKLACELMESDPVLRRQGGR